MILPVYVYGNPVLREKAKVIEKDYKDLNVLIADMFETMYKADGVGLAAPQIGLSIRLIVIDTKMMSEDDLELKDFKKCFINPEIIEETGEEWLYNEGCLSLPTLREDIKRKPRVHVRYQDENFILHDEWFEGIKARILQHEYDHIEGIVFSDRLSAFKRRLIKGKLNDIIKGNIEKKYKMKFIKQ
jgi:peptide deformylase